MDNADRQLDQSYSKNWLGRVQLVIYRCNKWTNAHLNCISIAIYGY